MDYVTLNNGIKMPMQGFGVFQVRGLLSELFGHEVPQTLRVFPPFYTDFGKNITVGEGVFINACCHFPGTVYQTY